MILHYGDLIDGNCLVKIINDTKPTEIYNLGAQSHVKVSFDLAEYTAEVDGVGTLRLLVPSELVVSPTVLGKQFYSSK